MTESLGVSPGVLPSGVRSRGGGAEGGVGGGGVWFSSWSQDLNPDLLH